MEMGYLVLKPCAIGFIGGGCRECLNLEHTEWGRQVLSQYLIDRLNQQGIHGYGLSTNKWHSYRWLLDGFTWTWWNKLPISVIRQ